MKAAGFSLAVGFLAEIALVVFWVIAETLVGVAFEVIHSPAFAVSRAILPQPTGDSFPLAFFCLSFIFQWVLYAIIVYSVSRLVRRRKTNQSAVAAPGGPVDKLTVNSATRR